MTAARSPAWRSADQACRPNAGGEQAPEEAGSGWDPGEGEGTHRMGCMPSIGESGRRCSTSVPSGRFQDTTFAPCMFT